MPVCYRKVGKRYYSPSQYKKLRRYLAFNKDYEGAEDVEWTKCENCGYYNRNTKRCKYCGN